jgi:hypothetical protein
MHYFKNEVKRVLTAYYDKTARLWPYCRAGIVFAALHNNYKAIIYTSTIL